MCPTLIINICITALPWWGKVTPDAQSWWESRDPQLCYPTAVPVWVGSTGSCVQGGNMERWEGATGTAFITAGWGGMEDSFV